MMKCNILLKAFFTFKLLEKGEKMRLMETHLTTFIILGLFLKHCPFFPS